MKKCLLSIMAIAFIGISANAEVGDRFTVQDEGNTVYMRVDADGDQTFAKPIIHTEYFSDLAAAASSYMYTTGAAGIASDSLDFSTGVFFGMSAITQPGEARNLKFALKYLVGASSQACTITYTIYGIDSTGVTRTEVVTATTTVSAESNYAYVLVGSVTVSAVGLNDVETSQTVVTLNMGIGDKIGIGNDITASTDIYGVKEGSALVDAKTTTISATYNTIDFVTNGNGTNDYKVWYKPNGIH